MEPSGDSLVRLVAHSEGGGAEAKDALFAALHAELHRLAQAHLHKSGGAPTPSRAATLTTWTGIVSSTTIRSRRRGRSTLTYTPHPSSKTAIGLLRHITLEDEWLLKGVADGVLGPMPEDSDACGIMTPQDAVARYKERIPKVIAQLKALPGDAFTRQVDCFGNQMPAVAILSVVVRHSTHHRGQLSTYLRPMGGKVPSIYGPSADTVVATA